MERTQVIAFEKAEEFSVREKGRCRKCWGSLVGRVDERHELSGIKCRVCGTVLQGEAARIEGLRMDTESLVNADRLNAGGCNAQYERGAEFVWKVFPELERLSEEELNSHVAPLRAETRLVDATRILGRGAELLLSAGPWS